MAGTSTARSAPGLKWRRWRYLPVRSFSPVTGGCSCGMALQCGAELRGGAPTAIDGASWQAGDVVEEYASGSSNAPCTHLSAEPSGCKTAQPLAFLNR